VISQTAAQVLNHLLDSDAVSRDRLARHAGKRVEFRTPPLPGARLVVEPTGRVAFDEATPADLVVTVNPLAYPLLAARRREALGHIQMAGDEALADTFRVLLLELRWDVEEDLSKFIGDVAAHRIVQTGRDAAAWQRDAAERVARNFTEYWTEEQPLIARRADFDAFARDVEALRAQLDALEARLARRPPAA
jgi:ubiquinone biosynthesis accessory factor UbiJ